MDGREAALRVSPEAAAALGLTVAEVEAMNLREFIDRATARGLNVDVTTKRRLDGGPGNLSVTYTPRP